MPYQKLAAALLAEWRIIEGRLAALDPRGDEADELKLESHRLRDAYQLVIEAAIEHHQPKPVPFPNTNHEPALPPGRDMAAR